MLIKEQPTCANPKCGHKRNRHFAGSMVKGHQACLVVNCDCRLFKAPEPAKAA